MQDKTLITLTHGHTMYRKSFHEKVNYLAEKIKNAGMIVDVLPKQKFSEEHDIVLTVHNYDPIAMRHIMSEGRYSIKEKQLLDCTMLGIDYI